VYVQNQASTVPLDYLRVTVGYKLELYELRKYSGFDRKGRVGTDVLIEAHQLELHSGHLQSTFFWSFSVPNTSEE